VRCHGTAKTDEYLHFEIQAPFVRGDKTDLTGA